MKSLSTKNLEEEATKKKTSRPAASQLFDVDLQDQPLDFENGVLDLTRAMEWQLHLEVRFLLAQVTVEMMED